MIQTAVLSFLILAAFADAGYKAEVVGRDAVPETVSAEIRGALSAEGVRIVDGSAGKVYCEIWLRAAQPSDAKSSEMNITLPELPHGAFLGVIRYPVDTSDRRGQAIKAGVYTLRYSQFPITGDHQGVAPQRDFLVLGSVSTDRDPSAAPDFKTLMGWAAAAAGTNHPMSLSIWKSDDFKAGFGKEGERDWVLQRKIGSLPLSIILIGQGEGH
jgi:hypothetical protein